MPETITFEGRSVYAVCPEEYDEMVAELERLRAAQPAVPDMDAIRQAVARGWCHPLTSRKAMDQTLAEAISEQVFAMLSATEDRKDE